MASKSKSITKEEVRNFLKLRFVVELATTNNEKPTCSPMVYVIDDDLNFYFVTKTDTCKAKNLRNNPRVSLSVWEFSEMSIQIDGEASEVTDMDKKEWVIEQFSDAVTNDPNFWAPIFRIINNSDYVIYKIKPTWIRALDLSSNTVRSKQTPFSGIEVL